MLFLSKKVFWFKKSKKPKKLTSKKGSGSEFLSRVHFNGVEMRCH